MKIKTIACVNATDMPYEVEEWCIEREYSTHCDDSIAQVTNGDNVFANWLRENGYTFKCEPDSFDWVGIIAT